MIKYIFSIFRELFNTIVAKGDYVFGFCEDCKEMRELWIYNDDVTPNILHCKECWQFVQQ